MASTIVDESPTRLYPKLYPTLELEDSSAHFLPIQPQRGEEEREGVEEGVVPNGEEEGGSSLVNGDREEGEEEAEEKLESSDQQESSACRDSPSVVVSPSQASSASGSARETTAEADNTEQTTNGDATMTDFPQSPTNHTPDGKLQTGETVDQSRLAKREEYVDRVWDEFVTHFLLGSCHIQKAAIFDLATRSPLAMNGNLRISTEEMEQLVNSLHYLQLAYRNGVTLEGKTYKVRLADGRNGILARTDREGCTICKTHTLIIVGVHDERGNSRKCNEDVMRLGDFFRKKAV